MSERRERKREKGGGAQPAAASISMEARQVDALPPGPGWQFEPKWDGFRCLARKQGGRVELTSRSGKSLSRYFPDVVERLMALPPACFFLDGELIVPVDGRPSFEELQLRLHPSTKRVRGLADRAPALLVVFDILEDGEGHGWGARPLAERRRALAAFCARLAGNDVLRLSPASSSRRTASRWLARAGQGALDGVVAKRLDQPYRPGERAVLKIKRRRTIDCAVGGYRYASAAGTVGSLLLGLYDEQGRLNHIGFTSSFAGLDRRTLTRRLEGLRGGPGFTGDAPGGPSRWATERSAAWVPVQPRLVVEVEFDQVTGRRLRHAARFVRWRPDKAPRICTFEQLEPEPSSATWRALLR